MIGVDFNPDLIRYHADTGYELRYGNAEDSEFLNSLPLEKVRWIVSSVRDRNINHTLLHGLLQQGYSGQTAFSSHSERDARSLKEAGADFVVILYAEVAQEVVDRLLEQGSELPYLLSMSCCVFAQFLMLLLKIISDNHFFQFNEK